MTAFDVIRVPSHNRLVLTLLSINEKLNTLSSFTNYDREVGSKNLTKMLEKTNQSKIFPLRNLFFSFVI